MENLVGEIIGYIKYLKDECGLYVSIHDADGFLTPFIGRLAPYNIHSNPYCLLVKLGMGGRDKCITHQKKVVKKCRDGAFFGTCYAGVDEFVFPIKNGEEIIGFTSVSGYNKNTEKTAMCRREFALGGGAGKKLEAAAQSYLKTKPPKFDYIAGIAQPLCRMLELLDKMRIEVYGDKTPFTANSESIYGHMLAFVEKNFASPLTVSDIARACHCSVSHVSHTFKSQTGLSVSAYVNKMRIKKAVLLLTKTQLLVQEISDMCGFSDSNYFSNVFKEHTGMSPTKYRRLKDKKPYSSIQFPLPPA